MARLVVIAPGRGSYNRTELNYILGRFQDHPRYSLRQDLLRQADTLRAAQGRPTISEMDQAASYSPKVHLPGENASALIFTGTAADFQMLAPEHEVVATVGNSMGWYSSLYLGGALSFEEAFRAVDTMGNAQKEKVVGGQVIYPLVDEHWCMDPQRIATAEAAVASLQALGPASWVGPSICLGGFMVYAGTEEGIKSLLAALPKVAMGGNEYPFQLPRHSAFHTHLMADLSAAGNRLLGDLAWKQPKVPMIDGRGWIWRPGQTIKQELAAYTLGHQVLETYNFTASLRVALREYTPDHLVLMGPGETLGGSIAHVLIAEGFRGIRNKSDFLSAQKSDQPVLISMDRPDQAARVI